MRHPGRHLARHLALGGILLLALLGAGCGQPFWLPPAHKIEVQQGNLISLSQRQSVAVGQTREQVLNLLGQPMSRNAFHQDRWDYLYTRGPMGSSLTARRLTLYFDNDVVSQLADNYENESGEPAPEKSWWQRVFRPGQEPAR